MNQSAGIQNQQGCAALWNARVSDRYPPGLSANLRFSKTQIKDQGSGIRNQKGCAALWNAHAWLCRTFHFAASAARRSKGLCDSRAVELLVPSPRLALRALSRALTEGE
jgi:hypothetical protein